MRMLRRGASALLILAMAFAGLALLAGGARLVLAGGSLYYVLAGAALLGSAIGFGLKRRWAMPLYGLTLLATLIWAWWEAGLDGWALVPRVFAPALLGLVLVSLRKRVQPASSLWLVGPMLASFTLLAVAAFSGGIEGDGAESMTVAEVGDGPDTGWRHWGRTLSGERFSPLKTISRENVDELELAWRYDSDVEPLAFHSFQATPLMADGRLYVCLDRSVVVALDPDSGEELWRFDPKPKLDGVFAATCRGVSWFEAGENAADCPTRIIYGVHDNRLVAIDAATGKPCQSFGDKGSVDLKAGLGDFRDGIAYPTSPPVIVNGVAVTSGWVTDGLDTNEPSGVIRGIDATTGAVRWAWDYGRSDPAAPLKDGETYTRGAPNAWGVFSGDEALRLVYVPTGVATPDYFGAHRSPGAEKYANAIVALDVETGKPRWHFQTIHHDIWDHDIGSQPVLTQIGDVPALVAPTKRGQFFVLDRRNGKPIYPVIEKPVPQGAAKGDFVSKTQPFSAFPDVAGPPLSERRMWGITPLDQLWCRITFREARYEGEFTPPSVTTAIHYPGSAGGSNWGSVTIDPTRGLLIANSLYMADIGRLIPQEEVRAMQYADGDQADKFAFPQSDTPYAMQRNVFMSPLGVPCQQPPYGKLTAIDLKAGKVRWSKALGTTEHAGPLGLSLGLPLTMGMPNLGGSIATAGDLIFIGATQDRKLRAIATVTGEELWQADLPFVAAATPMTFRSDKTGRQFVIIASGGHPGLPGPSGGAVMAYALPPTKN